MPRDMTPETIIVEVCAQSNITLDDLLGHNREKAKVTARRKCAQALRSLNLSYPKIAKYMNRDHSSIIHYLNPTPSHRPKRGYVEVAVPKS